MLIIIYKYRRDFRYLIPVQEAGHFLWRKLREKSQRASGSNREKCIAILDSFNEHQLANIANMLQAALDAVSEAADDTKGKKASEPRATPCS